MLTFIIMILLFLYAIHVFGHAPLHCKLYNIPLVTNQNACGIEEFCSDTMDA